MTEKDYETEEFRLYVTGFNGHNPFYKQTAYLDFRWRLLDLHEYNNDKTRSLRNRFGLWNKRYLV